MASELSSLIIRLKTYQCIGEVPRPNALKFILDYQRFINTLENINNMVGLEVIKKQITHQVESFIVNYRRFGKPTYGQKLHTILYGPPGCGKTQIGEYLSELWASSGCLSSELKPNQQLFHHQPDNNGQSLAPKLNLQQAQPDAEKNSLRQNLAIQGAQLRQYQQKIQSTVTTINNITTQFNNVRKKVKSKTPDQEDRVQAKFQEIKKNLREITGGVITSNSALPKSHPSFEQLSSGKTPTSLGKGFPEILPVTVPKIPGVRSMFGNSYPPLLPHVPNILDPSNIISQLPSIIKSEPTSKPLAKFTRLTKGDLIGKFQGHTTDQVRKVLLEHVGGVVMIDEAYNLCTSTQDDFGKELLTEIINFMTTWPDKIIFIFAGYRKEMEDTIFKIQPGLARRFNWSFEITEYSPKELNLIFQHQLKNRFNGSATFSDSTADQLEKFFKDNASKFPHYGGDTERLCDSVRETFNQQNWMMALDDNISEEEYNSMFTEIKFDCIQTSFEKYLENSVKEKEEEKKKKEEEDRQRIQHIYN
ncbi:hypothetical protein BH23THE1_BH23THE1_32210 [soil metagenome]